MDDAYHNIRTEVYPAIRYVPHTVISRSPEDDAIAHVRALAAKHGCDEPVIIGWDFPLVSQEQINAHHMHGYTAAWVLPEDASIDDEAAVFEQAAQKYCAITVKEPMRAPFTLIPGAYKALMSYMQVNGIEHLSRDNVIECFELQYASEGEDCMDIFIAAV